MLVHLHVKNLALIDEIEVEFGPGLNILTGEKKSLQVDFYVASVGEVCESDGVIVDRRT